MSKFLMFGFTTVTAFRYISKQKVKSIYTKKYCTCISCMVLFFVLLFVAMGQTLTQISLTEKLVQKTLIASYMLLLLFLVNKDIALNNAKLRSVINTTQEKNTCCKTFCYFMFACVTFLRHFLCRRLLLS